jgi:hypothetical protein
VRGVWTDDRLRRSRDSMVSGATTRASDEESVWSTASLVAPPLRLVAWIEASSVALAHAILILWPLQTWRFGMWHRSS